MADRKGKITDDEQELLGIQEELNKLRPVVQKLKIEKQDLEAEIPKLTQQVIDAQTKADKIIADANTEAEGIRNTASTLYAKVKVQEDEANKKTGEANEAILNAKSKMDEAIALKTSNDNREKNIEVAENSNKAMKIKLSNIANRIKEMLEE